MAGLVGDDGARRGCRPRRRPAVPLFETLSQVDPASERRYVLTLSCPDRTGIVARIASFLAEAEGWIVEAAYHADAETGWFFTRQVVRADSLPFDVGELRRRFSVVAAELGGQTDWRVTDSSRPRHAVVLVTREPHCLHDLLGRVVGGELPVRIAAVIGNHEALRGIVEAHDVPFHHVPFRRPARQPPQRPARRRSGGWPSWSTVSTRTRSCSPG